MRGGPSAFSRLVLPAFAFKAVVIGGGYATGRELAEFFLPNGPTGGLLGIAAAALLWSVVCALTFLFAQASASFDYKSFFQALLGPFWVLFEIAFFLVVLVLLSVFGAAAGAIGESLFGWPPLAGTVILMVGIATVTAFGSAAVEDLFKIVTILLYGVYALFLLLCLSRFGERIAASFSLAVPGAGWVRSGLTYAGYNILGAVTILPVIRQVPSRRDAVLAGLLCGPLAMLPALFFFLGMCAFYPEIGQEALPSDFLLRKLDLPVFHVAFQLMIFSALLESGAGSVHAVNERVVSVFAARRRPVPWWLRPAIAVGLLTAAIFAAGRFGLVALIAEGYSALAWVILAIYVLPLLTIGLWRLRKGFFPHLC